MTQKMDEITVLAEKAAAYRRGGQHLCEILKRFRNVLTEILPERFWFKHHGLCYHHNYIRSNVGNFGPALCFTNGGRWLPVPEDWTQAGMSYYMHNDFSCDIQNAYREDILNLAARLPDFLDALCEYLQTNGEGMDKAAKVIEAMIATYEGDKSDG